MKATPLLRFLITAAVVVIALLLGHALWKHYLYAPWTRDGRVRAEVVRVAPDVSGLVDRVAVVDNQFVHKGDVLFVIDQARFRNAVAQAQANLAAAEAARVRPAPASAPRWPAPRRGRPSTRCTPSRRRAASASATSFRRKRATTRPPPPTPRAPPGAGASRRPPGQRRARAGRGGGRAGAGRARPGQARPRSAPRCGRRSTATSPTSTCAWATTPPPARRGWR